MTTVTTTHNVDRYFWPLISKLSTLQLNGRRDTFSEFNGPTTSLVFRLSDCHSWHFRLTSCSERTMSLILLRSTYHRTYDNVRQESCLLSSNNQYRRSTGHFQQIKSIPILLLLHIIITKETTCNKQTNRSATFCCWTGGTTDPTTGFIRLIPHRTTTTTTLPSPITTLPTK